MNGLALYSEFDPNAAAWLRELIRRGLIAPGHVDERDIRELTPDYVGQYTQFHAFAGIGVWSYALRLAGWSDDRPVWTGSPPCQPFSAAGKGLGTADERHLWPAFFHLLDECRPDTFFGEQVASKDALAWLDHVSADVEGAGYAFGAFDLCAAGFGAPHIRQRLKFVGTRRLEVAQSDRRNGAIQPGERSSLSGLVDAGRNGCLALPDDAFWRANLSRGDVDDRADAGRTQSAGDARTGGAGGGLADDTSGGRGEERPHGRGLASGDRTQGFPAGFVNGGSGERLGNSVRGGRQSQPAIIRINEDRVGPGEREQVAGFETDGDVSHGKSATGPTNGLWGDADWLLCRDGKWRPVEPGTFPLAHGAPARVGRLRGYGNAIVAPAAAHFIAAFLDAEADRFDPADLVDVGLDDDLADLLG